MSRSFTVVLIAVAVSAAFFFLWIETRSNAVFPASSTGSADLANQSGFFASTNRADAKSDAGGNPGANPLYDFSSPLRVLPSDRNLPAHIVKVLSLVEDITKRVQKAGERPIQIQETDAQIIVIWPSIHEGERSRHADYAWKVVIDKQSCAIVSRLRGS